MNLFVTAAKGYWIELYWWSDLLKLFCLSTHNESIIELISRFIWRT